MQGPIDGPVEQSSREGLYRDRKESMGAQMAETKQLVNLQSNGKKAWQPRENPRAHRWHQEASLLIPHRASPPSLSSSLPCFIYLHSTYHPPPEL